MIENQLQNNLVLINFYQDYKIVKPDEGLLKRKHFDFDFRSLSIHHFWITLFFLIFFIYIYIYIYIR